MKEFNILLHNFNTNRVEKHNIMPYLVDTYKECKAANFWWPLDNTTVMPTHKNELVDFVKRVCKYKYWSRCQYEWLMLGWPYGKLDTLEDCHKILDSSIKIDAWEQIEMNLDAVSDIFIENVSAM